MLAKKLLTSRQIFQYAVLARTVTKKALIVHSDISDTCIVLYCIVHSIVHSDISDNCIVLLTPVLFTATTLVTPVLSCI